MGTIYVLRNSINGKCYVGQTTVLVKRRIAEHRCADMVISRALRKYGDEMFRVYSIDGIPDDLLDDIEKEMIARIGSRCPEGYNVDGGGRRTRISIRGNAHPMFGIPSHLHPWFGRHHTEETKRRISNARLGRFGGSSNPMFGRPSPNLGKKFTDEHKRKIAEALRGRKHSSERIAKNRASHRGNHPNEETRRKMSDSRKAFLARPRTGEAA